MNIRNVSFLSARLLAMFLVVEALRDGPFVVYNATHSGHTLDAWLRVLGLAIPLVFGGWLWRSARDFALRIEIDALDMDIDQGEGERLVEPAHDAEGPDDGGLTTERALHVGAVLLGLWVLSFSLAALPASIAHLIVRPAAPRFGFGTDDFDIREIVFSSIRVLFGLALILGRARIADLVRRARYSQQTLPPAR